MAGRRRDYNRLGFALQVVTVRQLGMLLEHAWEIQREYGLTSYGEVEAELAAWVADQAWVSGDGPKAMFAGAVEWLRKRQALLPGMRTLERLVTDGRQAADRRLWGQLSDPLAPGSASALLALLAAPEGKRRVSELERLRRGVFRTSSKGMLAALDRLAELIAVGGQSLDVSMVPQRRVIGLAAYGLSSKAPALRPVEPRLHLAALAAEPDPPSLVDLRRQVEAMVPEVDLPELVLEVMSWVPGFAESFTHASNNGARVADLGLSVAAVLCAHAMNVGFNPVTSPGVDALTRDRLHHVDQNYIRSETLTAANVELVKAQAEIELAQLWGGGLLASVDGMRFVVPVRTIHARPNPKYFGRKPEAIITDTGSYSDIVSGLVHLIGKKYRPQLANLPDQRLWRFDPGANYGPLNQAARCRIDTGKIAAHWEDMCRVAVSIHECEVSAHDVTRMISRDGNPTPLGQAIAHYGRIFKTLHILRLADDEPYRREGKAQANLTEGRHDLGRRIYHGKKGG